MSRTTGRLCAIFALAVLGALLIAPSAFALPNAEEAAFTNPVAYELKSLLTTHFYVKLDTNDVWATLDILGADGSVVKTVYSGPTGWAGPRYYFPYWNGLDKNGHRLPSANYRWRLQLAKGTQRNYYYGNITVSKINFFIKGRDASSGGTTALADRYMIPGNVNLYVQAGEAVPSTGGGLLWVGLTYPRWPIPRPASFTPSQQIDVGRYAYLAGQTLKTTTYLRGERAVKNRGWHRFDLSTINSDYYITVIQ